MRQRGSLRACLVLGVLVFAAPRAAHSQATPEDHQKAVAAFQEARVLIKAGHCDQAIPKLEASLTFEPSVGTHLSIADCLESVDPMSAWKHLKDAERLAYTKHDDRMAATRTRAATLEPKLAVIRIGLAPTALELPGLEVRLDGTVVDRFFFAEAGALAVNPGRHQLTVTAPGKAPWSRSFEGTVGTPTTVNVLLEDALSPAPPPPLAPPPSLAGPSPPAAPLPPPVADAGHASLQRTTGWIVGGVGVAGIVLGAVAWGVAVNDKKLAENNCDGYPTCLKGVGYNNAQGDNASATHWGNVSTGAFIAGGALVAGGLLLYLTAPSAKPATNGVGTVRVSPDLGIGSVGLRVGGNW